MKCAYKKCRNEHNNTKYCSNTCRWLGIRKEVLAETRKHTASEVITSVRGVLKEAKNVFEYEQMCIESQKRSKMENPYGK